MLFIYDNLFLFLDCTEPRNTMQKFIRLEITKTTARTRRIIYKVPVITFVKNKTAK